MSMINVTWQSYQTVSNVTHFHASCPEVCGKPTMQAKYVVGAIAYFAYRPFVFNIVSRTITQTSLIVPLRIKHTRYS